MALPLGICFAQSGAQVTLLDRDVQRVEAIRAGHAPFDEQTADETLRGLVDTGSLTATTRIAVLGKQDAVIVAIGTPIDECLNPDASQFYRSCAGIIEAMRSGQLLILRSTVMPGTTDRLAADAAAQGRNLAVAYCPDRSVEGSGATEHLEHPQLVAGTRPEATRRASELFRRLGVSIIELAPLEAELGKLFTNAYRYITFAAANHFYLAAERLGANFHRIRQAITCNYPRMADFPRAGFAAGPCLLKDTLQLAGFDLTSSPLGLAAMAVNEGLPKLLVEQAKARFDLRSMTTGILGMAFKGKSDDPRGSLAYKLRKILRLESRQVLCTDPYIRDGQFVSLNQVLREADVLFVGACHEEYRGLPCRQPVMDCFGWLRCDDGRAGSRRRVEAGALSALVATCDA